MRACQAGRARLDGVALALSLWPSGFVAVRAAVAPEVRHVGDIYRAAVSPTSDATIVTITAGIPNTANAAGEMEVGDLIADAPLLATQPAGGARITFMNAGGVRNPGLLKADQPAATPPVFHTDPYKLFYGNAFTTQPVGNRPLTMTMTLTTHQIKDVLEQQFVGIDALVPYLAGSRSAAGPCNPTNWQLTKPRITPVN